MKLVYLIATELQWSPTLVRDQAERDGHDVVSVELANPETSIRLGDRRLWSGDGMDIFFVGCTDGPKELPRMSR